MADQPANIDKLLCTPDFGTHDNVLANHLTNKYTGQGFDMDNFGMMDVKTINSVFSKYNKRSCANDPWFSAIKIQLFLALHRHVQGKFLHDQAITAASILPILSKINQDYTDASTGIVPEYKDAESAVTPVVFNSSDKVIPLLAYWEVVLTSMKSVVNESKLECLLHSRHIYTPSQRAALLANSFEDSIYDIAMTGSAFMDDNTRAYDALISGIFSTLAEQMLTATINNENYF